MQPLPQVEPPQSTGVRWLAKQDFQCFLDLLWQSYQVIGPTVSQEAIIYD